MDQRTGKVKAPKALPIYRKGRWEIDRKLGWVKYDREPEEQPERAAGGAPASSPNRPSAQASRSPEEERLRDELLALTNGRGREYLEHLASTVGVPEGQRATAAQLSAMIDLALSEAANEPPLAREGGPESAPPAEEASEVGSP
ncbi:MAG: hypothetical protein JSV65_06605, partial [Armatimonadota bacterium]